MLAAFYSTRVRCNNQSVSINNKYKHLPMWEYFDIAENNLPVKFKKKIITLAASINDQFKNMLFFLNLKIITLFN